MNIKQIITALLLLFVIGSVAYMFARQAGDNQPSQPTAIETEPVKTAIESAQTESIETQPELIVYYFHGDVRCPTCLKLESYAREALETHFADELAEGLIIWKPTNVDQSENTHFVKDYGLVTKSVILSRIRDGEEVDSKNLELIWDLVKDKTLYTEYIRDQIQQFLEQEPS